MENTLYTILWWSLVTSLAVIAIPTLIFLWPALRLYLTPKGRRIKKLIDCIPGPAHYPIIGNAMMLWVSRERILDFRRANCRDYFPIYKLWYFGRYMVTPVGPEYVETILRSSKHIEKGWLYDLLRPWLGSGLLTSKGEKWFLHRKFLTPAFHFKILEEFVPLFIENSSALVEKLSPKAQSGEVFDITPVISQCALDVICESAMGIKLDREKEDQRNYIAAIYKFGYLLYKRATSPWYLMDWLFALTPLAKEHAKVLATLHSFTENVIKDKKLEYKEKKSKKLQEGVGNDTKPTKKKPKAFLELLIELSEEEGFLTDEEIREEVDTFMFEGHDTTSMAICWTLFMLANHPKIQDQLWEELEYLEANGKGSGSALECIGNMNMLERCIKETLRLYPSVPFITRMLNEEFQIGEYQIPKGTTVNLAISGIHMNPSIYPDPDNFDPDRFLPEAVKDRHPYAYVPFSAGPRNCIGQKFAMLEMKAVISAVIKNYEVIPVDVPGSIVLMHDIVLRPSRGIKIRLAPRK